MSRILVTGGEGFIGSRVVSILRDDGHEVWLTRLAGAPADNVIEADLRQPGALTGRIAGFEAIAHLAARSGGIGFQRTGDVAVFADNRAVTDGVLAAASEAGVERIFLASTAVVYRPLSRPHVETDPRLTPDDSPSPYAWSKVCDEMVGEWWARSQGGPAVVVGRFGNVYGPGGPSSDSTGTVVHTLVRRATTAAAAGRGTFEAHGDPATVRSFIFVDDVARAVALLLTDERAKGPFNVDTGIGLTIGEVADAVGRAVGGGVSAMFTGDATDVPYRVTDPARLSALGFAAQVGFSDGIARCVAAERLNR